ncbi:glucose-1-phosphate cytidylyltransferase [Patescibacteria group bacterium]|nr:glucose-1-phosphate cytidylyltransferase [Patescibacteria group bacterium]
MKTIILCGGKGTRLQEETEYKPKPMIAIGGVPILVHIMKIYAYYGHKEFILCLGYKADVIKDYFLTLSNYSQDFEYDFSNDEIKYLSGHHGIDYKITFANTGEEALSGERIKIVGEKYINDEQFMVTYGDGVSNVDVQKLIEFHNQHNQDSVGTITGVHPSTKYGLLKYDENFKINKFEEKPQLQEYINGGFMIFENSALEYVRDGEMFEDALQRMTEAGKLNINIHDDFWHSMDTYKDYKDLNKLWKENPKWKVWE